MSVGFRDLPLPCRQLRPTGVTRRWHYGWHCHSRASRSHVSQVNKDYLLPADDDTLLAKCRIETFRAGGPGGQHQNKTESAVRLTHLPTGITVIARESRSQHRNRQVALTRLRAALEERARVDDPRIPTRPPARAKRRRLEEKQRRADVKRSRKKPDVDE